MTFRHLGGPLQGPKNTPYRLANLTLQYTAFYLEISVLLGITQYISEGIGGQQYDSVSCSSCESISVSRYYESTNLTTLTLKFEGHSHALHSRDFT